MHTLLEGLSLAAIFQSLKVVPSNAHVLFQNEVRKAKLKYLLIWSGGNPVVKRRCFTVGPSRKHMLHKTFMNDFGC